MVESPDHPRDRSIRISEPLGASGQGENRPTVRRKGGARAFDWDTLERRELLATTGWKVWPSVTSSAPSAGVPGTIATVASPGTEGGPTEKAAVGALLALDAGIKAAQDEPVATTAERATVRESLLAIRTLAATAKPAPVGSAASSPTVAGQVAQLKQDILTLAQGKSLPDAGLPERLVAKLDALVASLHFTADDLSVGRVNPAPASSGNQAATPPKVTVTPSTALPTGPIFATWRTFLARPALA